MEKKQDTFNQRKVKTALTFSFSALFSGSASYICKNTDNKSTRKGIEAVWIVAP